MATKMIFQAYQNIRSWISRTFYDTYADNISGTCWILELPPEILQCITHFLTDRDTNSLSRTCQDFYKLINDDTFWTDRIRSRFSPSIVHLYTYELFQKPELISTNDELRSTGFVHTRNECEFDEIARNSATHYNDEAIERRHGKMYISKEDFSSQVTYFQYKKPKSNKNILTMKLIYFYLIDRKRQATVDMAVIHRNNHYLVERNDADSYKGKIIHLQSVCWLEITGRFEHNIMPGRYDVIWRLKCRIDYISMSGETEFIVVPSHGRLLNYKISENDFRTYTLEKDDEWISINMGQIIIYEPSKVLVAIRNWGNPSWKSGVSWDCIELKLTV